MIALYKITRIMARMAGLSIALCLAIRPQSIGLAMLACVCFAALNMLIKGLVSQRIDRLNQMVNPSQPAKGHFFNS